MSSSLKFQLILIVELFRLIFTIKTELGVFIIDIYCYFFCLTTVLCCWMLLSETFSRAILVPRLRSQCDLGWKAVPGSLSPGNPYPICLQLCLTRVYLLSSIHLLSMPVQENWRKAQGRTFPGHCFTWKPGWKLILSIEAIAGLVRPRVGVGMVWLDVLPALVYPWPRVGVGMVWLDVLPALV